MSTELAERRKGRALALFLAAAALILVAAVTVAIEYRASRPDLASGLVVPGLHDSIAGGRRILIVSRDASYRIERAQRGEQSVWVMRDRGDYPVLSGRLAQLVQGIEQLRYTRRMTSDPAKFDRLGVGDPRQGGGGVLVRIEDAHGALLVNLILGMSPTVGQDVVYVRRPDQSQTWAARGQLPPLRDVASWLNLKPLDLAGDHLLRTEITPAGGRLYVLARDAAGEPWRIVQPVVQTPTQSSVADAAERITQLSPVDVQPAPAIQGDSVAGLHLVTTDGVSIDAELIPSAGKTWIKLVARALEPGNVAQEQAALAINDRASAWAYALSDIDAQAIAPQLSALVPSQAPPRPTPAPEAAPQ